MGVTLFVYWVYAASPVTTSSDSKFVLYSAASFLTNGDWNLNEFSSVMLPVDDYKLLRIDGDVYSYFSLGPSLVSIPFLVAFDALLNPRETLSAYLLENPHDLLEWKIASAVVALAAGAVFLFSKELLGPRLAAIVPALVFAFGTSAWSTASRAMWQHGPSMLMISTALFLLLRARSTPALAVLAGPVLAFGYVIRPTNGIALMLLTIPVFLRYREYFIHYVFGVVAVFIPFAYLNLQVYGGLLPPYFDIDRLATGPHFFEALWANLISPSRGLFVYSPILLMALYGLYIKLARKELDSLDYAIAAVVVVHWVVISSYPHWWAGHSYGPRFFCDVIPCFIYFLAPVTSQWRLPRWSLSSVSKHSALVVLMGFSIFVHGRGAMDWSTTLWNPTPVGVDQAPQRVWDWRDPQFLRTEDGSLLDLVL